MSVDPPAGIPDEPAASRGKQRLERKNWRRSSSPDHASQPSLPAKISAALAGRRSSSPATFFAARKLSRQAPPAGPSEPPAVARIPESDRCRVSRPSPRRIHIDLRDTSDVWQRRSVKEKMSLGSIRPSSFLRGVDPPWFMRALFDHSNDKSKSKKNKSKSKSRSKDSATDRSARHKHRHHSNKRSDKNSKPQISPPIPMPMPAAFATDSSAATSGSREPTVQFLQPMDDSAHVKETPMPMPTHTSVPRRMVLEEIARAPASAVLQLGQVRQISSKGGSSKHNSHTSMASADDDNQQLRIYKVLGRKPAVRNLHSRVNSDKQISPVLVTIARDGSVISDLASRPSEELPAGFATSSYSKASRQSSPVRAPLSTASRLPAQSQPEHQPLISNGLRIVGSPGQSSMSTAEVATTNSAGGAESFATAKLFTGTLSPKPVFQHDDDKPNLRSNADVNSIVGDNDRLDEVSDIAMRNHLEDTSFADDDQEEKTENDGDAAFHRKRVLAEPSGESLTAADKAFSEWLKAQAAVNDRPDGQQTPLSIAQTVARMPFPMPPRHYTAPDTSAQTHLPFCASAQTQQRHYSPSMLTAAGVPPPSFSRAVGSDQVGLLEGMMSRVSDLESRFTCIEAMMSSFNDKLDILLSTSKASRTSITHSLSIGNASESDKSIAAAGKTPAVVRNAEMLIENDNWRA
ncbi:hypothetical protein IWW45_006262 [Coemansia sp. RSA 485]|nr:hypothetical protein IWW45_006262 [Coemansia sp. RSA 485]